MTNPEAAPLEWDDDEDATLHTGRYLEMKMAWEEMVAEMFWT